MLRTVNHYMSKRAWILFIAEVFILIGAAYLCAELRFYDQAETRHLTDLLLPSAGTIVAALVFSISALRIAPL
jgi:hypothetical protein